jgi:hypothetical protein
MLDPTLVAVGGNGSINPYGTNNCSGATGFSLYTYFNQTNARWWSGNTSTATVTSFNGHGVAPGTTNGYATATVPSGDGPVPKSPCPQLTQQGQNNVKVQVPTASRIVSQVSSYAVNSSNVCPSGQAGWHREVKKIVTDQTGADMVLYGQNLAEKVTIGTPNNLNVNPNVQTGTAVTDQAGNFNDILQVCSPLCPSNGQTNATQTISDVLSTGAGPYTLSPNAFVYTCTGITINGQ